MMNIQTLNDTELNRAIIWLYPPKYRKYNPFKDSGEYCCSGSYEDTIDYDYLTDWNLTMPLAVENGLIIGPMNNSMWPDWWEARNNKAIGLFSFHEDPLRAICEVLVMIGMEGK